VCRGSSLWFFEPWIGGLCSLLEHGFCLGCVELLSFPKGSETCLLQVILFFAFFGFRSLVGVYFSRFFSFLFSFDYQNVCVVNALVKGEIESIVWFEDRWMVTSWCDE
jgi:hypothetical protein